MSTSEEVRRFIGDGRLRQLVEKEGLSEKAVQMIVDAVARYVKY